MKGTIEKGVAVRWRKRGGVAAAATVAMLGLDTGSFAGTGNAAETIQKAVLSAEHGTFAIAETNALHKEARISMSTDGNQTAFRASDERVEASHFAAPGRLSFWTLSAGGLDGSNCGWTSGSFECANSTGLKSSSNGIAIFMDGATGTFEKTVNHERLLAGSAQPVAEVPLVNAAVNKAGDLVTGNTALTSPVPEPRIFAMMLAGLGLMGFVASRR
jgi:hypothetical protein